MHHDCYWCKHSFNIIFTFMVRYFNFVLSSRVFPITVFLVCPMRDTLETCDSSLGSVTLIPRFLCLKEELS